MPSQTTFSLPSAMYNHKPHNTKSVRSEQPLAAFMNLVPRNPQDLEVLAQTFFKYQKMVLHHMSMMRHDPVNMEIAVNTVNTYIKAENARLGPLTAAPSQEQINALLQDLADKCDATAHTFEEHAQIAFAADTYSRMMMTYVVCPGRPSDMIAVTERANQLLREDDSQTHSDIAQNVNDIECYSPTGITISCGRAHKLTPDDLITQPVVEQDIARWHSSPGQLVGKGFVSPDRRVFVVVDYAVKQIRGPQYDVVYEGCGSGDALVVDSHMIFDMLTDSALIMNM